MSYLMILIGIGVYWWDPLGKLIWTWVRGYLQTPSTDADECSLLSLDFAYFQTILRPSKEFHSDWKGRIQSIRWAKDQNLTDLRIDGLLKKLLEEDRDTDVQEAAKLAFQERFAKRSAAVRELKDIKQELEEM